MSPNHLTNSLYCLALAGQKPTQFQSYIEIIVKSGEKMQFKKAAHSEK